MPISVKETVTRLAAISKLLVLSYIIDWIFIMCVQPIEPIKPPINNLDQRHRPNRLWLLQTISKPPPLQLNRSNNQLPPHQRNRNNQNPAPSLPLRPGYYNPPVLMATRPSEGHLLHLHL